MSEQSIYCEKCKTIWCSCQPAPQPAKAPAGEDIANTLLAWAALVEHEADKLAKPRVSIKLAIVLREAAALVEKWRSWEYLSAHVSDSSTQGFTQAANELEAALALPPEGREAILTAAVDAADHIMAMFIEKRLPVEAWQDWRQTHHAALCDPPSGTPEQEQPCCPETASFRCLGYDCEAPGFVAGSPESRCGCAAYVRALADGGTSDGR